MELVEKQRIAAECLAEDKYSEAIALYEECIDAAADVISNYWNLGVAWLLQGKELEAQAVWLSVLCEYPEQSDARTVELIKVLEAEGLRCLQADKYQQAAMIYWQIIEQNPSNREAYKNLGNALVEQGKLSEAIACYQQAVALDPNYAAPYYQLGYTFHLQGKLEEAIAYYQQYLILNPNDALAYYNLGHGFETQGKLEAAIACYRQALILNPKNLEAVNNLGNILQKQGKLSEAIACYEQSLPLNHSYPPMYYNLGHALQMQGKVEPAIACYQQALTLDPHYHEAANNLGNILHMQGKIEAAISCYHQAITLAPQNFIAHYNLGCILMENCQYEQALGCFNRAIEINPDYAEAHWNRALILLQRGDYKRGLEEYEWRWQAQKFEPPAFTQPLWNGEDLEGRIILLYAEQGFGDTIQFIRYASSVQQRHGNVVIQCQKPLVRLLKTVAGIKQVVATDTTLPEFDVQAPLLSLPRIMGTTVETIPVQIPYLAPPESSIKLSIPPGKTFKIGIVWASGYRETPLLLQIYKNKSCPLPMLIELLRIPSISLYSLQIGVNAADLNPYRHETRLQDLSNQIYDFGDTAAAVAQLDLVLSVDTAVAHLAGALGKPVWVLLPFNPDWRWLLERSDSPWYPTMRLFRQQQPGDWAEVVDRVHQALLDLTPQ